MQTVQNSDSKALLGQITGIK